MNYHGRPHGHFELNVFKPLQFTIFSTIEIMSDSAKTFALIVLKELADKKELKFF